MPTYPVIRFIYRRRISPVTIIGQIFSFLTALTAAIWFWPIWRFSLTCILVAVISLLLLLFNPTVILMVTEDGLTLIKRPLIRIFGSYDFFAISNIRYIRYSSALFKRNNELISSHNVLYSLDVITNDSRIVTLISSFNTPLPATLGKELAQCLPASYEEYLDNI